MFRYTCVAQPAVELGVGGADNAAPYSQVEGSGVQLTQHCGHRLRGARMYMASNRAGRCTTLPGNSSSRGYVSSQWSRRQLPADIPGSVVGAGGEGLASSRIHQQLDLCGPFGLPAGHRETDGDALSSAAPMRVSLVSPRFLPQLGGVEAVVGYLAEDCAGTAIR